MDHPSANICSGRIPERYQFYLANEESLCERTDIFGQFLYSRVFLHDFFALDELLYRDLRLGPFRQFLKRLDGPLCIFESDHSVICISAGSQDEWLVQRYRTYPVTTSRNYLA
jgi:hypothetical protein